MISEGYQHLICVLCSSLELVNRGVTLFSRVKFERFFLHFESLCFIVLTYGAMGFLLLFLGCDEFREGILILELLCCVNCQI